MKRIFCIALSLILLLTALGCNKPAATPDEDPAQLAKVAEVNYVEESDTPALFSQALNASKLPQNPFPLENVHCPIHRFNSAKELETFRSTYDNLLDLSALWFDSLSFGEATADMDREFFETYSLLAVYFPASSGSHTFSVKKVEMRDQAVTVYIEQDPWNGVHTDDLAAWIALVPIQKTKLSGITDFDAILNPS